MGDIIKEIEGKTVIDSSDLFRILDSKVVGDKVKVTVDRGGESKKIEVTLGALKN